MLQLHTYLPKLAPDVPFARRDPHRSVSHVHTPIVNILGEYDVQYRQLNVQLLEASSAPQNHSE